MKKLWIVVLLYWVYVALFVILYKQNDDLNTSFPAQIVKMVKGYIPLQPKDIQASDFFKGISQFNDADRCEQLGMNRNWSIFYPLQGLVNLKLNPDSVLPAFKIVYEDFDSSFVREMVRPVIDSMCFNEYHQQVFRFESHYLVAGHLSAKISYQELKLNVFEPENPYFQGVISDPIDALHGACIEFTYKLLDSMQRNIPIDHHKPLIYEIKSTADTVTHIFSFYLKDYTFFDIRTGRTNFSIVPPPRRDYVCITKDDIGKLIYLDSVPLLVSAFEKGILHLVYDSRVMKLYLEDFYLSNKGEFLETKVEGTVMDFSSYHIYRNNTHMSANQLCNALYKGDNIHKFKQDLYLVEGSVYYEVLIVEFGCDADQVHISKKSRYTYDDILGSRIMFFRLDTVNNEFEYMLLKKDKFGTFSALHEDTTRTKPHYEGLAEELMEYLVYPVSDDMRNETMVQVQVMVHKDGTMTDVKLFSQPGDPLLDEDALNAVKSLKNKWKPATLHGEPIDLGVIIPIHYRKE